MPQFSKKERLCSHILFNNLLKNGKTAYINPLKIVWLEHNISQTNYIQIAISVPKKKFKSAVSRNLIKRRIREAYRLNKYLINEYLINNNKKIIILFVYNDKNIFNYFEIENKIIHFFNRLNK